MFYQTGAPPAGLWLPDPGCRALSRPGLNEMVRPDLATAIRERGPGPGLRRGGLCRARSGRRGAATDLAEFLARGYHGDMGWLAGTAERRGDPQALWPEARTVVVLGVNYAPEDDPLAPPADRERAQSRSMRAGATITTP